MYYGHTIKQVLFWVFSFLVILFSLQEATILLLLYCIVLLIPFMKRYDSGLDLSKQLKQYYLSDINYLLSISIIFILAGFLLEESKYGFLWVLLMLLFGVPYLMHLNNKKDIKDESGEPEGSDMKRYLPSPKYLYYGIVMSVLFAFSPMILALILLVVKGPEATMVGILIYLTFPIGIGLLIIFCILLLIQEKKSQKA